MITNLGVRRIPNIKNNAKKYVLTQMARFDLLKLWSTLLGSTAFKH